MLLEEVDDAVDEGDFGADNRQVNMVFLGEGEIVCWGGARKGKALGDLGDARVAGCGEEFGGGGTLGEFPGEGVFAAASADDEDIQGKSSSS